MFEAFVFYIFAGIALGSAIGCVVSTNIVRTAVCLLGTLGGVAGLYFLLYANLLAVIQLIVYAGGTLILIIFGVMLTSKSPWMKFNPRKWEIGMAGVVALMVFFGLSSALATARLGDGNAALSANAKVAQIGEQLLTTFLVPFEVASVLLLVVMIGAAYMARIERK